MYSGSISVAMLSTQSLLARKNWILSTGGLECRAIKYFSMGNTQTDVFSLRECMAEATGVFFYVFPGIAAVASFTVNAEGALPVTFFGNIFQVGFAFALGIAFAIITCAPVSGGHFNPAITLCFAIWQGFPWRKVPHYILSQIFGAFVAGLVLIGCYWPEIQALKAANIAQHGTAV